MKIRDSVRERLNQAYPETLLPALGISGDGRNRWLCPACQNDGGHHATPDLSTERAGAFKCHRCGKGWDAIGLVQFVKGCGFRDACAFLLPHTDLHASELDEIGEAEATPRREKAADAPTVPDAPRKSKAVFPTVQALSEWFAKKNGVKLAAQYDYRDADYKCGFAVLRFKDGAGSKRILPVHAVPGGWSVGDPEGGGKLPLYGLEHLGDDDTAIVCEGEKCVDVARSIGLENVFTSAHGSQSAHRTDWTPLAGRDVVILPDNDESGEHYAREVAAILRSLTPPATLYRRDLPGLAELGKGADIYDWLAARSGQYCCDELVDQIMDVPCSLIHAEGDAVTTLANLPDPIPESDNPAALFKGGWLRKGGGAFLIAPSGQGKSTWTIQAAICWAMGKAAFGIEPVRPLNVCIIQAEDDPEEMAFFRNQIGKGLKTVAGLDPVEIEAAMRRITIADATGKAGAEFISWLADYIKKHPEIDLLIINPCQSYFGGDVSHNAELTEFLRVGLDPLIKPGRVGVLFVHHTNKPPNAQDRKNWGTDAFSAYIGAGGAELVNWARAMLALMPVETMPGVFRLVAGKRGGRLGWVDAAGAKTNTRLIAHHDEFVYWRDVSFDELETVNGGGGKDSKYGDAKADADELAVQAQAKAWKLTDLRAYAEQMFKTARGRRAFDCMKAHAKEYSLAIVSAKYKAAIFIGTRPEAEQAAAAWDASKGEV